MSYRDRLVGLFKSRPYEWISWTELAREGGALAWRTRVSDCRKLGMEIREMEKRHPNGVRETFRMYCPPKPVGPAQPSLYGDEAA